MFYYLKDKNNKVVCFNTDRNIVKNTIPFLKHIQNFTEKDIIETFARCQKEIIDYLKNQ